MKHGVYVDGEQRTYTGNVCVAREPQGPHGEHGFVVFDPILRVTPGASVALWWHGALYHRFYGDEEGVARDLASALNLDALRGPL